MSTRNLKLKRTFVVLVSLALLLMPNFIVFADGVDDISTTPETEQTTGGGQSGGGEEQPGDDESGDDESGDDESGDDKSGDDESGDDESGDDKSGDDESGDDKSGDDESGDDESGDDKSGDDQSGDDQSGDDQSGDDQSGDDQSGDGESGDGEKDPDKEDPPPEMAPMLQGASMQLNGWSDRTLTLSKTGNGKFHVTVYYWQSKHGGSWQYRNDFDSNGGDVTIYGGDKVKVEAIGTDGYQFKSWSATPYGASISNNITEFEMYWSNKSVGAVFEQSVHNKTLTFDNADGLKHYEYSYNGISGQKNGGETLDVPKDTTVTVTAIAANDWHQVGWIHPDRPSNTGSVNVTLNKNRHVKASFAEDTKYTLTFVDFPNGLDYYEYSYDGGSGQKNGGEYIEVPEGKRVTVTAHANTGWHQVGWSDPDDPANTGSVSVTMSSDKSAAATFEENPVYYELKFLNNAGNNNGGYFMISGDDTTKYYHNSTVQIQKGTEVTVIAHAKDGYYFNRWKSPTPGTISSNTVTFTMNEAETVKGDFKKFAELNFHYNTGLESYRYKIEDGSEVTVSPTPTDGSDTTIYVPVGKEIYVYASAASNYENDGWYNHGGYDGNHIRRTSNDQSYDFKAKFELKPQNPKLIFHYNEGLDYYEYKIGNGSKITVNPTPTDGNPTIIEVEASHDDVYVYATPLGTHLNDGWFENGIFDGNHIHRTSNDQSYDFKAKFKTVPTEYTLTLYNNDGLDYYTYSVDGGSAQTKYISGNSDTVTIPAGKPIVLRAYAKNTHSNNGWSVSPDGATVALDNIVEFNMDGNKSAKANFTRESWILKFLSSDHLDYYSYEINGGGETTATVGAEIFVPVNANVKMWAYAETRYRFQTWTRESPGKSYELNNPESFTMTQDETAQAVFEEDKYRLSLDTSDSGISSYTVKYDETTLTVSDTGSRLIPNNVEVTVTANLVSGRAFTSWSGHPQPPTSGINGNEWVFTMSTDYSIKGNTVKLEGEKFRVDYQSMLGTGSGSVEVYYNGIKKATLREGRSVDITYQNGVNQVTVKAIASSTPNSKFVKWHNYGVETATMDIDLITGQAPSTRCAVTLVINVKPEFAALGSLTVTKVDKDNTEKTLSGAKFTLSGNGITPNQITTGNDGKAYWDNLPEGTYTLTEDSAPAGYSMPDPHQWTIKIGANGGVSGVRCPTPYKWDVTMQIENKAEHCGLIIQKVDVGGNLITSEATFKLKNNDTGNYTTEKTTVNGVVEWTNLIAGEYSIIEVSAPDGYYWQTQSHGISLTPNSTGNGTWPNFTKEITNYEYASVKVVKKDQSGNAMEGVTFTLTGPSVNIEKDTDENGEITWDNLKPGDYTVTETVPSGYYMEDPNFESFNLSNGETKTLNFKNYKYASIKVVKTNQAEVPMQGVTFTLKDDEGNEIDETATNANGEITWNNLKPGDYTVTETVPSGYYIEDANPKPVSLKNGDTKTVAFMNHQYASVKVIKKDQSGTAMQGVTFTLTNSAATVNLEAQTNSNGIITWDDLKPGTYTVTETVPDGYYLIGDNYQTFTLDNGDDKTVAFKNYEYASVKVVKKDQNNEPIEGVTFTLTDYQGLETYETTTDENGEITWDNLKPGDYTVTETVPSGYYMEDPTFESFSLSNGDEKTVEFKNYEYASIKVIKGVNDQSPMAGVIFKLTGGPDVISLVEETDANGEILWENLKKGEYVVTEVVKDGYYLTIDNPQTVTVDYGDEKTVNFMNYEYVEVYAMKQDINTGAALSGAIFEIYATQNGAAIGQALASRTTGADGRAFFDKSVGLISGKTYWIKEVGAPWGYQNDAITAAGQEVTIDGYGESNQANPVLFENTPILQSINVVKQIEGTSAGTLLDGTTFKLYLKENGTYVEKAEATLTNGTCSFDGLVPGDYKVVEVGGDTVKFYTLAADETRTLELVEEETSTTVVMNNTFTPAAFTLVKHDSLNAATVLSGAVYELTGMQWTGATFVEQTFRLTTAGGVASVSGLTPGVYTLREVTAPTGYDIDPTTYTIDIMPGRSIEEAYDVADDKLGAITLAKFEQGGTVNRVSGARFSLYRVTGATRTLIRSGVTDANGNIVFDFLPAGDYVLVETAAPTNYTILGNGETAVSGLRVAERRTVIAFNGIVIVPPPPPAAPENLVVAAPQVTPTPSPTPTPINTDELIIDDVDPAYGPETGEGDTLFITIGILLLLGVSLFIIKKKAILKNK